MGETDAGVHGLTGVPRCGVRPSRALGRAGWHDMMGVRPMADPSFLDIRGHGFARVAVCVPEVRVADPAFNAAAHVRLLEQVHAAGAQYALCPELGISAYSCGDLFFQETLLRTTLEGLRQVAEATAAMNLT